MIRKQHGHQITVTVTDKICFSAREADFLRKMAEHCVETNMPGSSACETLIEVLNQAGIPRRAREPIYGLFEAPGNTPSWIKED